MEIIQHYFSEIKLSCTIPLQTHIKVSKDIQIIKIIETVVWLGSMSGFYPGNI